MSNMWIKKRSEYVLKTPWMNIRKDHCEIHDGKEIEDFYVLEEPDVVMVYATTKDNKVILVRQYKHGIGKQVTELPAGFVDKNENPDDAAKRELEEETGYVADDIVKIGEYVRDPTRKNSHIHVYKAVNAKLEKDQNLDHGENIEIILVDENKLIEMIKNKDIDVIDSVASIFLAS